MKIISGGQTGADRAALDFAIEKGIEHGGWCPKGRRSQDGQIPEKYKLIETASHGYSARTELNVMHSNVTVIFKRDDVDSPGSILTEKYCRMHDKPYLILGEKDGNQHTDASTLASWLETTNPQILNVAGHREESCPGIYDYVMRVLTLAKILRSVMK
jgi:hypothetical protein